MPINAKSHLFHSPGSAVLMALLFFSFSFSQAQRLQLIPGSFEEIEFRYNSLRDSSGSSKSERPYFLERSQEDGLLFLQLQPLIHNGKHGTDTDLISWVQLSFNNNLTLINEMQMNYASQNTSTYDGKEWRSINGLTNQSFLRWANQNREKNSILVQVGRFYSQLGEGRHGQLFLGAAYRPMDQLYFSFSRILYPNFKANFYFQTSALDKINSNKRFMSLHGLQISSEHWYVAINEALLYSRSAQGPDLVYLNPFIFYHLEQLNGPELLGNTMGTGEFGYKWDQNRFYIEVLIDDVQLDNTF
ncbi:hypothetical protein HQ531_02320 [bacterium]|nr:hypothetical protein [bacterium]